MRAYAQGVRARVFRAVDEGKSRAEIIDFLQVLRATIKRDVKQRHETGDIQSRSIPGRTPKKGAALEELLEAQPDARLEDYYQREEHQYGVQVSTSTIRAWLFCHSEHEECDIFSALETLALVRVAFRDASLS